LRDGTSSFDKTLVFEEASIHHDDYLSYQLFRVGSDMYVNFGWADAGTLHDVLKTLYSKYDIKKFYMYGKCGSLSDRIGLGQIVAPVESYSDDVLVKIDNVMSAEWNFLSVRFTHVDSPLLETKTWKKSAVAMGCQCVDMELVPVVRALPKETAKKILYYISDRPNRGVFLSDRLGFVEQRLACSKIIIDDLLEKSG